MPISTPSTQTGTMALRGIFSERPRILAIRASIGRLSRYLNNSTELAFMPSS